MLPQTKRFVSPIIALIIIASGDEDVSRNKKYDLDLESKETRCAFAQRLKDALRREAQETASSSSDSSYAVGISVTGSGIEDQNIKYLPSKKF